MQPNTVTQSQDAIRNYSQEQRETSCFQSSKPIQQLDHCHLSNSTASPQNNTWKPYYSPYCIFTISYTLNPHSKGHVRWNQEISTLMGVSSSPEPSISLIQAGKLYVGSLLPQTNPMNGGLLPLLYYCWWAQGRLDIWPMLYDSLLDSAKNVSPRVVGALSNALRRIPP